jgi:large subunit ribosomal protein L9
MDIILLERIAKLGGMGDEVTVKDGYARNYLLPKGKALRANKTNRARFEAERTQLEARNEERKTVAQGVADKLNGNTYIAVRSAGETGQLYGSVAARDIVETLSQNDFNIGRSQVELRAPIKVIGLHDVLIQLHPEVEATITMNVARSEDEAVRQAAGEDLTRRDAFDGEDEATEESELSIEDVFENPDDVEIDEDGNVVSADEIETAAADGDLNAQDNADESAAESGDEAEASQNEDEAKA